MTTIKGKLLELQTTNSQPTEDQQRLSFVEHCGLERVGSRVSISSQMQFSEDQRKRKVSKHTEYEDLIRYAEDYQRSHRLEEYVAHYLRKLGLLAVALPAIADGNTRSKQADVIISSPSGQKLALEVKEARHNLCTVGLPKVEGDMSEGFTRYPSRLIIDSCRAWDEKEKACERRGELLLGAVILCPIGRLSDEDFTVLGAVYCPSTEDWSIRETSNRGRYYDAYVSKRSQMRTIADLVTEVNSYA